MHFVAFCTDRSDAGDIRLQNRPEHRRYIREVHYGAKVVLGGATLADDGHSMNGTLLVFEADSMLQVEAFLQNDPYSRAGLFAEVQIRGWAWGLGLPGEEV